MKIRTTALLTIIAMTAAVTVLSLLASFYSIRFSMDDLNSNDVRMTVPLASRMVSDWLVSLKTEHQNIAKRLLSQNNSIDPKEAASILKNAVQQSQYLSMALFDSNRKIVASYGGDMVPDNLDNPLAQRAQQGEITISSPDYTPDNTLIFRVYTPVGKHLLVSTLSALTLTTLISEHQILPHSNITILDREGFTIASGRKEGLLKRFNPVKMSKINQVFEDKENVFGRMTQGETGTGRYRRYGEKRVTSFAPIPDTDGWSINVTLPESDTTQFKIKTALLASGVIILIIGSVVAIFAANIIAKPFDTMRELKQVAENALETKSSFLANTSHEMRTPLNAIIGLSELMLNNNRLPPESAVDLEKIYISGVTLLGIVNDLLDIAKIEAGKFELVPAQYDVPSMINDARSLNELQIADKNINFLISVDETLPSKLIGDELRIKQIFNNLLSNACKYTDKGSIQWTIQWEREEDNVWLISSIRDTGIGIHEEDICKLFSNYSQIDTRHRVKGTGLGLSIARRMAEAMNGTITVSSIFGEGSTFTVRLQQKFVDSQPIGHKVAESLKGLKQGSYTRNKRANNMKFVRVAMPYAKVLVVDDVQTNLDVARGIMAPYDMQIDCCISGIEAIKLIREAKTRYDAIFMDHMMPDMDGIEAARIIREEIGTDYAMNIPIIALTANAITGNDEMFLQHGFQDFLTKPIDVIKMDATLRRWVRNKQREHGIMEIDIVEDKVFDLPKIDGIDLQAGINRFGGDKETYLSIVNSYTTNTEILLDKLSTTEKLNDYAIIVHGIKGSSYSIEANSVGKKAEELEYAAKGGNEEFILQESPVFVRETKKFIASLSVLFNKPDETTTSVRHAPDQELLKKMAEFATNFKIDEMEETMRKLEDFRYETQSELITWLRKQVNQMEFEAIRTRLSQGDQK